MRTWIALALLGGAAAWAQDAPPSKAEMAGAYRSKCAEHALPIPGARWERWCTKEIRGWSLKFKRVSESRLVGVIVLRYQAEAKKNGTCAEYRVEERVPLPPPNPQVKLRPGLTVEPGAVEACR